MAPNDPIDIEGRLVRVETKIDFIIKAMENLPPSPACTAHQEKTEKRLVSIERFQNIVVGGLTIINIVFIFFSEKLRGLL